MEKRCILSSDVDSVVLPIDACGGDGALAFARRKKKVIVLMQYCFLLKFSPKLCKQKRLDLITQKKRQSGYLVYSQKECYSKFFSLYLFQPLIIVVEENETVLSDTPDKLQIEAV